MDAVVVLQKFRKITLSQGNHMAVGIMSPSHLDLGNDHGVERPLLKLHRISRSGLSIGTQPLHECVALGKPVIGNDVLDVDVGGTGLLKDNLGAAILKLSIGEHLPESLGGVIKTVHANECHGASVVGIGKGGVAGNGLIIGLESFLMLTLLHKGCG